MEEGESTLWENDRKGKTKRMQSVTYMIQIEKIRTKKPNPQRNKIGRERNHNETLTGKSTKGRYPEQEDIY